MSMSFRLWAVATVALCAIGYDKIAQAGHLTNEYPGPSPYLLTFGTQGSGTSDISGTGMQFHGAFDFPGTPPLRFFDGESGGSQETGDATIAYKNNAALGIERITDHMPVRVPAVGTNTINWGTTFDGTAMWLGHSRFNNGTAPPIGSDSMHGTGAQGTRYPHGNTTGAQGGMDAISSSSHSIFLPVVTGQVTTYSYYYSSHVFMPDHSADKDGTNPISTSLRVGGEVDREGFGLRPIGGTDAAVPVSLVAGQWAEVIVRGDFTIDGGASASNSDDSGTVSIKVYRNGAFVGSTGGALDPAWMTTRFGPVRFALFYGHQRGWQGTAPEAFVDNISVHQIFTPEPSGMLLLAGGMMVAAGRRRN